MYTENDLVRIAKRDNNTKRNYLVVNRLQGKHVPVKASDALTLFEALADKIDNVYQNEKLLFVGFAETATAIGAAVAKHCGAMYMQTTREIIEGVEYLYFSEEHSHATEQKLVRDDIEKIKDVVDRIVFVEDEITTGKTILNIIDVLNREYPDMKNYSVMSILNGMNRSALERYREKKIDVHYLIKTDHETYSEKAAKVLGDGVYVTIEQLENVKETAWKEYEVPFYKNARRLVSAEDYECGIQILLEECRKLLDSGNYRRVLVLGTEEFMYPALRVAAEVEKTVPCVMCHSTTRSPIVVSSEDDYPLQRRYELKSLYDCERRTFIYNLENYDYVMIVTDAHDTEKEG